MFPADHVILKVSDRQGYAPAQVRHTLTLADLRGQIDRAIDEFGPDALIVTDNGDRYGATFGGIDPYGDVFAISDEDEVLP